MKQSHPPFPASKITSNQAFGGKFTFPPAVRGTVYALFVSALLCGCSQQEQLTELTDNFHKKIEDKEKELIALRASEKNLQVQVSQLEARVGEMQREVQEVQAKIGPAVDYDKLARTIAEQLAKSAPSVAAPSTSTPTTRAPMPVAPQPQPRDDVRSSDPSRKKVPSFVFPN